jgi:hypothetical protein
MVHLFVRPPGCRIPFGTPWANASPLDHGNLGKSARSSLRLAKRTEKHHMVDSSKWREIYGFPRGSHYAIPWPGLACVFRRAEVSSELVTDRLLRKTKLFWGCVFSTQAYVGKGLEIAASWGGS